jgi:hypothetical protein
LQYDDLIDRFSNAVQVFRDLLERRLRERRLSVNAALRRLVAARLPKRDPAPRR